MNRPDLESLTEEDLVRATNAGLVKRATREEANPDLTATMTASDGTLIFSWSDGVRCEFPPGCAVRATCSCPAPDVCRHILRSILRLQREGLAGIADSAEPEETSAATDEPTIEEVLSLERADFVKHIGRSIINRAERLLTETTAKRDDTDRRAVRFPLLGVETLFPTGSVLGSSVCTCREAAPCSHVVPALLVLRGEETSSEDVPSHQQNSEEADAALSRCRGLLVEVMRVGLDGLSTAWTEAAQTTALEVEKVGLEVPAQLLRRLAENITAERTGERPFQSAKLRWDLAALWLRVGQATERATPTSTGDLVSLPRAAYWSGGRRQLLGLGVRAWVTPRVSGITLYLFDEASQSIVTTGTARPADLEITAAQLAASAPLLANFTAREIVGHTIDLSATRWAKGGKLRLEQGGRGEIRPEPIDWKRVATTAAIERWADLADRLAEGFPTLISMQLPTVQWFLPARFETPRVDFDRQVFLWPMIDAEGRSLPIVYRYTPERSESFEALQSFVQSARTWAVLGELRWSAGKARVEPITLLHETEGGPKPYLVDIDRFLQKGKRDGRRTAARHP